MRCGDASEQLPVKTAGGCFLLCHWLGCTSHVVVVHRRCQRALFSRKKIRSKHLSGGYFSYGSISVRRTISARRHTRFRFRFSIKQVACFESNAISKLLNMLFLKWLLFVYRLSFDFFLFMAFECLNVMDVGGILYLAIVSK